MTKRNQLLTRFLLLTFSTSVVLTPGTSHAGMFAALSENYLGVMSDNDSHNGATSNDLLLYVGYSLGPLEIETFGGRPHFSKDYTNNTGRVRTDIKDWMFGLGGNYKFMPYVSSRFGLAHHSTRATYKLNGSPIKGPDINGTDIGPYLGLRGTFPIWSGIEAMLDGTYYRAQKDISFMGVGLGVRYNF